MDTSSTDGHVITTSIANYSTLVLSPIQADTGTIPVLNTIQANKSPTAVDDRIPANTGPPVILNRSTCNTQLDTSQYRFYCNNWPVILWYSILFQLTTALYRKPQQNPS